VTTISDPEVQALAGIAGTIQADYAKPADDPWAGSPFEWILGLPSRTKGAVGEMLVAGWCAAKGFDVIRSPNSQADRIIEGHRIEIKFSTLWKTGVYKFQQIRDQDYDYCFCLGVSPFDAHAWLLSKATLYEHVIGHMGQHTGAAGTDTAWLSVEAAAPLDWLAASGGRLADVHRLLSAAGRGSYA
jgi:hypothetical protein